jgi:signal peptidase II
MKFSKRVILIILVSVSCVSCDQTTKSIAAANLPNMKILSYFGNTLRLQLTYNPGAFLSLGSSLPEVIRHSIFTVGTCFILLGVLAFALFSRPGRLSVVLAFSLFLAGGIGNLIDRIIHHGSVVDFINIGIGSLRTGIFNIADVVIMGGFIFLFFGVLRKQKENR